MTAPAKAETTKAGESAQTKANRKDIRDYLTRTPVFITVILICVFWSLPTLGVLMSSFRSEREINTSGWWAVFAPQRDNPDYTALQSQIDDRQENLNRAEADLEELQTTLTEARATLEDENLATVLSAAETELAAVQTDLADLEGANDAQEAVESAITLLTEAQTSLDTIAEAEEAYAAAQTDEVLSSIDATIVATDNALDTLRETRSTINLNAVSQNIQDRAAEIRELLGGVDGPDDAIDALDDIVVSVQVGPIRARDARDGLETLQEELQTLEGVEVPQELLTQLHEQIMLFSAIRQVDAAIEELSDARDELNDGIWGVEDAAEYVNDAQAALEGTVRTDEASAALSEIEAVIEPALAQATAWTAVLDARETLADAVDDAADDVEDAQEALAEVEGGSELSETLGNIHTDLVTLTTITETDAEVFETRGRIDRIQVRLANDERILEQSGEPEKITFGSKEWREQWTLDNYEAVFEADNMDTAFLNSLVVTIPSVVIPITLAAFAAFAFAWMEFPGRNLFFAIVVILMVVPLHTALIPILRIYLDMELNGTYLGIWLAHTGFGMPLAVYLLYGYIATIPREILESAKVDGASPFTTFVRLIVPLSVPAIASFAIFQFLWVWNDLLVALVFLGTEEENRVLTRNLSEMVGSKGQNWEVLTAGAFVTMIVPLLVFFFLQRYFVRGLMAGSVKG